METRLRSVIFALFAVVAVQAAARQERYGFIENKGQLRDQHRCPVEQVRYLWPAAKGINVQVLDNGVSYDTYGVCADGPARFRRIDMRFEDASPWAHAEATEARHGRLHFITPDGRQIRDVRHYSAVRLCEVYPGVNVDLRIAANGSMKYDIVVEEGADLSRVRVRYTGHDVVGTHADALRFDIAGLEIYEHIPASWAGASRTPVRIGYRVIERGEGSLLLGLHRMGTPDVPVLGRLTIDPQVVFQWGTYLGGADADAVLAMDVDAVAMHYVAGRTRGFLSTATTGAFQSVIAGGTDAFLAKVAPYGSRLWCTYFGGAGDDEALGIDVDDLYRVHLVGRTTSATGLATDSAFQLAAAGGTDAFIAMFDSLGQLLHGNYLGGVGDDEAIAVRAMADGRTYVCGTTTAADLFDATTLVPVQDFQDSLDAFVIALDVAGTPLHATFLGGEGNDALAAIDLRATGTAYAAGRTTSSTGIDTAAYGGAGDGWLCALDTALVVQWSRYVGGAGNDALTSIDFQAGNIGACGSTTSEGLADSLAVQTLLNGAEDALVLRTDTMGNVTWSSYFGGEGSDRALALRLTWEGRFLVGGVTNSQTGIALDTLQLPTGGENGFLVGFGINDSIASATYVGGELNDAVLALANYAESHVSIAGSTYSQDGVAQDGFQMSSGGSEDGFIARYENDYSTPSFGLSVTSGGPCQPGGSSAWNGQWGGTPPPFPSAYYCVGDTLNRCISGGSLAFGHYWYWYANDCGDPQDFLAIGPCISMVVQEDMILWVRSEGPASTGSCTGLQIYVEDYPTPLATAPASICQGDTLLLNGSGGESYAWSGPGGFAAEGAVAQAATDTLNGSIAFVLTAFSAHGCARQDTATTFISAVPPVAYAIDPVTCFGGSDGAIAPDSASAGLFTFQWTPPGITAPGVSGLADGACIATVTDTLGCTRSDTLFIAQPPHPVDTLLVEQATCGQSNGAVAAVLVPEAGAFDLLWSPGEVGGNVISGLDPGTYTLALSNVLGCAFQVTATVIDTGSIIAWALPDPAQVMFGDSIELLAFHAPLDPLASTIWNPIQGLACPACATTRAAPVETTSFIVTLTSSFGCMASDTLLVEVIMPPLPKFFVPTHFSPNGDGLNESFMALGGTYARMRLSVIDRYGQEVFTGEGERPQWDGNVQGRAAASGVYTYVMMCTRADGGTEEHAGSITLLR